MPLIINYRIILVVPNLFLYVLKVTPLKLCNDLDHLNNSMVEDCTCRYIEITISTKNSDLDLKRQMANLKHIVLLFIVHLCGSTAPKWL